MRPKSRPAKPAPHNAQEFLVETEKGPVHVTINWQDIQHVIDYVRSHRTRALNNKKATFHDSLRCYGFVNIHQAE
jgi:hypothetical protein